MELPPARVLRDGGVPVHVSGVAAPDNVRRLAARKLPRRITWHLLLGGDLGAGGWLYILFGLVSVLLMSYASTSERRFVLLWMSVIGLVNILRQLRIGRRILRLLRHGVPSWGRVVAQEKLSVVVRRRPPIATTLAYPLEDGTSRSIRIRTERREFADGEYCWILYDAAEPGRATVLRRAPGAPTLSRDGDQIVLQRRLYGWTAWVLPIASVVAAAMATRLL